MENCGKSVKHVNFIFLVPIWLLLFEVTALFIHGFWGYSDAAFINGFASKTEKCFLAFWVFLNFVCLFAILGKQLPKYSKKTLRMIEFAILIIAVLLQCYFLFFIKSYYKWDGGYVISAAASLVDSANVSPESYHYVSVYPNQNTFVCITALLVRICEFLNISVENRPVLYNVFNTVLMDIAVALIIPTYVKIRKKKTEEWEFCRMLIFLLLNPFWYLGTSYYYTITLSLPFTMGFLYLFFDMIAGKSKWYLVIAAGVLLGVGYDIRPTAIVFAIAGLLTFFYNILVHKGLAIKKCGMQILLLFCTAVLTGGILSGAEKKYIGIDTTNSAYPTVHWLMMAASYPGGHNIEDEAFTDSFPTYEEKEQADLERLKEKLKNMGVKGIASLAAVKVNRTFGDGSNGYMQFLSDGYGTGTFFDWLCGGHRDLCVLYHQGYFLFMMAGILSAILKTLIRSKTADINQGIYCLLLALFGAYLFYAIWESSAQYSIPFMGLMTVIAFFGFNGITSWIKDLCMDCTHSSTMKRIAPIGISVILCCAIISGLLYGMFRYPMFVNYKSHYSRLCADQLMSTAKMEVTYDAPLYQPVELDDKYNQLVFQWRNYDEQNNAVYRVEIIEDKEVVWSQDVDASSSPYHGVGAFQFPVIEPDKTKEQAIVIRKIGGDEDKNLFFLVYDMYGYNPYPGGSIQSKNLTDRDAALMFALSYEYDAAYISKSYYWMILLLSEVLPVCAFVYFVRLSFKQKKEEK